MASWDMGYHADLLYTTGYYREISPVYLYYLLTSQGFDCPKVDHNLQACELGFGQGLSINLHALCSPVHWYGTDFNPTQAYFARTLASQAGLTPQEICLADDSFGDFLQRTDLPEFDYICLHGIWSWISPENQQYIVDFAKSKLKLGGVLYISYNTAPGFTTFEPIRHLMANFDREANSSVTAPQERLQKIATFLNSILEANPAYAAVVPGLKERIASTMKHDYHYLSGEYLNSFWDISHFDTLAKKLETAKLSFACSATLSELLDGINLTAAQQKLLAPYKGSALGENMRDFIVNQQFRRDLFIKGPRKLSAKEKSERLSGIYVTLGTPVSEISYSFNARQGKAELKKDTYEPLYNLLSDYQPHSIGHIKEALADKVKDSLLEEAILTLVSQGFAAVTRDPNSISDAERQRCLRFNHMVLEGYSSNQFEHLASPLLGGGCYVSMLNQKLLSIFHEHQRNQSSEAAPLSNEGDITKFAEDLAKELERTGQKLKFKGQEVTDHKKVVKTLTEHVSKFKNDFLPYYQAMGVV